MRPKYEFAGAVTALLVLSSTLAPEAHAFRGRGAAFVVGAAVGSAHGSAAASSANASAASSQQQAAYSQQQAAAAQHEADEAQHQLAIEREKTAAAEREAAAAKQQAAPAPPPVAAGTPLPLGIVVATLPAGCTATPVGGVNYYYCSGNFYQAVYEGSTLKYITAKPK